MAQKAPIIILLLALAIALWSSFVWRRKFLTAEEYSDGLRDVLVSYRGDVRVLEEERDEFKKANKAIRAENGRLRDYVRVLESSRVRTDDWQIQKGKIYGVPDQPRPTSSGVVAFDPKTGRWSIT